MAFWCQPVHEYWSPSPKHCIHSSPPFFFDIAHRGLAQCSTYHNHSITVLAFNLTTTIAVLVIPVPFIRTPRKFLLAVLLLLSAIALTIGLLSRYYILAHPTSLTYLSWHVAEPTVILLFANLPFLSSLVASTTTSRIRHISSNISLSQWPRSYKDTPPFRAQRLNSTATTMSTMTPLENADAWTESGTSPITPPITPVQRLNSTDPPPELEAYCATRRPSTKNIDVEKMFAEPGWPLR